MSAAARAELSGMLDMTSIVAAAGQNEEDEDEEDPATASAIETRFAVPALLRANVVKKPTPRGDSGASAVLAGSAPLQFASV